MAQQLDLQCLNSVKNRTRSSKEALQSVWIPPRLSRAADKTLYDIEIVAEEGSKVKIHYVGYDVKFDEWRPKEEIELKKPKLVTQDFSPLTELACQIKRKLAPTRHQDPAVIIHVPTTIDSFSMLT